MKFTNIFNVYKELLCTTPSEDAIYKKNAKQEHVRSRWGYRGWYNVGS